MAEIAPVTPSKKLELETRFKKLGISEKDIVEKFTTPGTNGGQKANKTSCCVYLKHIPTSIEVKCRISRSRSLNRFLARRILSDKIEEKIMGEKSRIRELIEKKRRQKRKRSKRAKEKMLATKKIVSVKKERRRPVKDAVE